MSVYRTIGPLVLYHDTNEIIEIQNKSEGLPRVSSLAQIKISGLLETKLWQHFDFKMSSNTRYKTLLYIICSKLNFIKTSMEIWYINLRKSLEIKTSLIFSNVLYSKSFQESRVYFRHYAADCMPSF